LIVCEHDFTRPSPLEPDYSMKRHYFYTYVLVEKRREGTENHRLFLIKNLKTDEYELDQHPRIWEPLFKDKDLKKVLEVGNTTRRKFWPDKEDDTICTHEHIRCNGRRS